MSLIDRASLRRLEKAAREKDKRKLAEWMEQFEYQMENIFSREYEDAYHKRVQDAVDNIMIAVAYTLHFSEETKFGPKKLPSFIEDLLVTIDLFRTGEYKPSEYSDELAKAGIILDVVDYDKVYKNALKIYDTDLVRYLGGKRRKIVTICGSSKFKNEILEAYKELELGGYIVFMDGVFVHSDNLQILADEKRRLDEMHLEKILMSDAIYVINKGGYIGESTKQEIEYAKAHNKEVKYLEPIQE